MHAPARETEGVNGLTEPGARTEKPENILSWWPETDVQGRGTCVIFPPSLKERPDRCPQLSISGLLTRPSGAADLWPPRCHLGERLGGRQSAASSWVSPKKKYHMTAALLNRFLASLGIVARALKQFKPFPERGLFFLRASFCKISFLCFPQVVTNVQF